MSQADQGISGDNLVDVPLKRKRGRPRKYPQLNFDENVHIAKHRGKRLLETFPILPGSRVNGNQSHPANPIQNAADGMLGQVVSGVIEAVFEAGYLLCVRVGNPGITLRGVVFKPGHCVPISRENDVAPDVQMIRRSTVPFGSRNYTQMHRCNPRSRSLVKPGSRRSNDYSNQEDFKEKSQITLSSSRGKVVPVVLKPVTLTNGLPVATESLAIQTASKGKEVLTSTSSPNGSAPPKVAVGIENSPFQTRTSEQVLQDDASLENNSLNRSSAAVDTESKSMKLPSTPFENLVTEVMKRIQAPVISAEMQTEDNETTTKISAKECEDSSEAAANVVDEPLMIEPLKAVQPAHHESSESISKAADEARIGKITDLFQGSLMQNEEPWAELNSDQILEPEEIGG